MIARTITHCRDCGGERMDGDPHWCSPVVETEPYSGWFYLTSKQWSDCKVTFERVLNVLADASLAAERNGDEAKLRQVAQATESVESALAALKLV